MERDERNDERTQRFPFEGLHVYARAQDAWTAVQTASVSDPLWSSVGDEVRNAAVGIARATARSRANGAFAGELEEARGAIHAAAALVEQLERRDVEIDDAFRGLLSDTGRMLGALIRTLRQDREEPVDAEVAVQS